MQTVARILGCMVWGVLEAVSDGIWSKTSVHTWGDALGHARQAGAKMQRQARLSGSPSTVPLTAEQNGREPWSSYSEPPPSILSGGQFPIGSKVYGLASVWESARLL
jgi:hypothetical protein